MFVNSWISKPPVQLYFAFFVRNTLGNKRYLKVLYVAAVVRHKAAVVDNLQYVTHKACHNWQRLQRWPGIGMNLVWLKWYHALRTRGYNSDCIVEHRAVHAGVYSREPCCRVVSLYAMYTQCTHTHADILCHVQCGREVLSARQFCLGLLGEGMLWGFKLTPP